MQTLLTSWFLTLLLHSTLLGLAALAVASLLSDPNRRSWVLRLGLFGGLLTASVQVALGDSVPMAARLTVPFAAASETDGAQPGLLGLSGPTGDATPGAAQGIQAVIATKPAQAHSGAALASVDQTTGWALPHWTVLLVGVWLAGACFLLMRLVQQRAGFLNALARRPLRDVEARRVLAELSQGLLRRRVRVSTSPRVASPLALSSREICVPSGGWQSLAPDERRGLLAHELAHVERRDPAWFLAAHVVERVLFLQPLARILRKRMQREAEFLCDDWAARRTGEPLALARCLASVATWSSPRATPALQPGMAEMRSTLLRRVERILHGRSQDPSRPSQAVFAAVAGCAVFAFACTAPSVDTRAEPDAPELAQMTPSEGSTQAREQPQDKDVEIGVELFRLRPDALVLYVDPEGRAQFFGKAGEEPLGTYALDDEDSLLAFRGALERAAAMFPRGGPLVDGRPGSLHESVSSGLLRIRTDNGTTYKYVQRVMELCGTKDVQLWNIEIVGSEPGAEVYRVPLPVDVGVAFEPIEEVEEPDEPIEVIERPTRIEVILRVDDEAEGGQRLEVGIGPRNISMPKHQAAESSKASLEVRRDKLAQLRQRLGELYKLQPTTPVTLDVRPGVVYADVVGVLDEIIQSGFTHIMFVGEYR